MFNRSPDHGSLTPPRALPLRILVVIFGTLLGPHSAPQSAPNHGKIGPPTAAASPFAEAEALFAQGRTADAKQKIQEQLELNAASVDGYNLLGIVFSSERDYSHAFDAFSHALKLDPNSAKTHNNLGNFYVAEGKPDLAESEFRKVLGFAPANRDANYNLGLLLIAKGLPASAITYLQHVRPANIESRLNLIRAYLQAGRTAKAMQTATQLSAQKKDDIQVHFTLGLLLASSKQYKVAERELEIANALQPES